MSTKITSRYGNITRLAREGDEVAIEQGSVNRLFDPQRIFDALRAEGFVDRPKAALERTREAIGALAPGTRFQFNGPRLTKDPYLRTRIGYRKEISGSFPGSYLHDLCNPEVDGITVLPPLPTGDEVVRGLAGGVKFTVGDEAFIKTEATTSISLKDGRIYAPGRFGSKTVVVSS